MKKHIGICCLTVACMFSAGSNLQAHHHGPSHPDLWATLGIINTIANVAHVVSPPQPVIVQQPVVIQQQPSVIVQPAPVVVQSQPQAVVVTPYSPPVYYNYRGYTGTYYVPPVHYHIPPPPPPVRHNPPERRQEPKPRHPDKK